MREKGLGDEGKTVFHEFANNNVNLTDPSGQIIPIAAILLGAAAGAAISTALEVGSQLLQGRSIDYLDMGSVGRAALEGAVMGGIGGGVGAVLKTAVKAGQITRRAAAAYSAAADISTGVIWDMAVYQETPSDALVRNVAAFGVGAAASAVSERLVRSAKGVGQWLRGADDDVARAAREGAFCSFSEDTTVATEDGEVPIGEIEVGDEVLAYDEATGETGEYEVSAVHIHEDETIVYLTIASETLETTPEHPFYTLERGWVAAGELQIGDHIRTADWDYGEVQAVEIVEQPQTMYNLTVDEAHTFFVGDGQWLVHNTCDFSELRKQAEILKELGTDRVERREILRGDNRGKYKKSSDPAVFGEIDRTRTPDELDRARTYYKNNKEKARELWERRTGQPWPVDAKGNPVPGDHNPDLKEGGHPLRITPNTSGDSNNPHMIPGPDGLTDHQRWGALGAPAREARRRMRGGGLP